MKTEVWGAPSSTLFHGAASPMVKAARPVTGSRPQPESVVAGVSVTHDPHVFTPYLSCPFSPIPLTYFPPLPHT